MNKSINEWMVFRKVLNERKMDIKRLRDLSAVDVKTVQMYGEGRSTEVSNTAKYDVKVLDRRITGMQNADLLIESAIKQSNAMTQISLEIDVDSLLSPIE